MPTWSNLFRPNGAIDSSMSAPYATPIKQPQEFLITLEWHVMPDEDKAFIEDTAFDIAWKHHCDIIAVRSRVHKSTFDRDVWSGKKLSVKAPSHYTAEFHVKATNEWFASHVYVCERTIVDKATNRTRVKAEKLERVENIGIVNNQLVKENPQLFRNSNPTTLDKKPLFRVRKVFPKDLKKRYW